MGAVRVSPLCEHVNGLLVDGVVRKLVLPCLVH